MKSMLRSKSAALTLFTLVFLIASLYAQSQDCTGFRTQTQGGWGAVPHGNNPGAYLHDNFSAAFPNGLTIGCATASALSLTSAQAVTDFLPSGSIPSVLPVGKLTDPGGNYSNVLAGQLVTAVLNVGFDNYDPDFSSNTIHTGGLVIKSGPFIGWTINQLIDAANNTIGGCSSTYSVADLNVALTSFNENYDNGTTDKGFLTCTHTCNLVMKGTTSDVTCNGSADGLIDITVSGAEGKVKYLWNDSDTSGNRSHLAPGDYSVIATDEVGCQTSASFTITEPRLLDISAVTVNITKPDGNDGSIDLVVTGGTPPYQYQWNDGSTDEHRTGLRAGGYSVVVTDSHGCNAAQEFNLTQPSCNLQVNGNITDVCCFGSNTGAIYITVNGNNGAVTYLWNDGNTDQNRINLVAGTYAVTATDAAGCTTGASFIVRQAKKLRIDATVTGVSGRNKCDGSVSLVASGGHPPYTFTWNDGFTGANRDKLCAGSYSVTVTDKKGCSVVTKVKVICISLLQTTTQHLQSAAIAEKLNALSVSVSPNPAKDQVRIRINKTGNNNGMLRLFDPAGKLMMSGSIPSGSDEVDRTINLGLYPRGLYILQVISASTTQTFKIILE